MSIFKGAGVALITPFQADGSMNYDKLDELIDYHCENGTDSIIICGTTGESSTLTEEEHMECIKFTIERTKKRIPVIAGNRFQLHAHRSRDVKGRCGGWGGRPACRDSLL